MIMLENVLEETHAFYHGEEAAFGALVGLQIADASRVESEEVFSCASIRGV